MGYVNVNMKPKLPELRFKDVILESSDEFFIVVCTSCGDKLAIKFPFDYDDSPYKRIFIIKKFANIYFGSFNNGINKCLDCCLKENLERGIHRYRESEQTYSCFEVCSEKGSERMRKPIYYSYRTLKDYRFELIEPERLGPGKHIIFYRSITLAEIEIDSKLKLINVDIFDSDTKDITDYTKINQTK